MALSLDEALGVSLLDESDSSIHIDLKTRQVVIPENELLFGVESDDAVEVKHIVIDGRYDDNGKDLSALSWRVNFRNANGDKNAFPVTKVTAGDNTIEFDWLIRRSVVAYKGTVDFVVCAFGTDSDGNTTPEWNSTLGHGQALEGLEVDAEDIGGNEVLDELKNLQVSMKVLSDSAAKSASDAKAALDAIPADYTQLNNDVSQLKEDLSNKAEADKFNAVLKSLESEVKSTDNVFNDIAYVGTRIPNIESGKPLKLKSDLFYAKIGTPYILGISYVDGTTASFQLSWNVEYEDGSLSGDAGMGAAITPTKKIVKINVGKTANYKNEDLDKIIEHIWLTPNGKYVPYEITADSKRLDTLEINISKAMISTDYMARKNLLIADNITDNLQIQPFATVIDENYCSAYIPVKTGETLYVNYSLGTPVAYLCDAEKTRISYVILSFSNDNSSRYVGYTITTENIAYIRLSWLKSKVENRGKLFFSVNPIHFVEADSQFKKEFIPELSTGRLTNWWLLKNGDSLGDSLTGQGFFQSWTRRYFGLATFANHGVGGSKLSGSDVNSTRLSMWKDERINNLNANADFVTVLGGQNDGNVEIGEISKSNKDTNTYVGALNTIIDKIYAHCGNDTIIILCCPFWVPSEGENGSRFITLGNAVKSVAQLHGLPVADFGGLCGADYNTADRYWGTDKTHPLELFYKEKIAPILISTMEAIKPIDWDKIKYYTES